jgi:hypothetical protein
MLSGLDHTELIKMSRMNPLTRQTNRDRLIFQTSAATSSGFCNANPKFYLVSTEDGLIHKC